MARPKKDILKSKTITVHCTQKEYEKIKGSSKLYRMTMSDYLRGLGLNQKVETKLNTEEIIIYKSLSGMANNLNQIARRVNSKSATASEVMKTLEELNLIILKLL